MADLSKPLEIRKKRSGWRAGAGTALSALILIFGAYYFIRVQQKTAWFGQRNLRILGTISTQLGAVLQPPAPALGAAPAVLTWRPDEGDFRLVRPVSNDATPGAPPEAEIVSLEKLAAPVLKQTFFSDVFDSIVLADEKGVVRWQYPSGISSLAELGELAELRGFGKEPGTIATADLQRRAYNTRISLEGREFRFFAQPVMLEHLDHATEAGGMKPWVVAGIVSRGRFAAATGAVSYTLLISVLAAFLLVIFSLPFLKLGLLGELQRVRVGDILMLGVALLCAIAVITLIFLDAVAYRRTRAKADAQLRNLASDIKRHMRDEIQLASAAMLSLDTLLPRDGSFTKPIPETLREHPLVRAYPFFESFSRISKEGEQRQKWMNDDQQLSLISVADRDYFRKEGWGAAADGRPYVLQAIRSWTTGVTQAVISQRAPYPTDDRAVIALAFPMKSLIDTVVAGGCQFVVIDDAGSVVFHSERQRNGVENFFVETDRHKALRAAVAGRQNEMISLRYWGEDQRAFTTPVEGTPWTLVTFRSKRLLRTLNVETIMIAVMFLLIHALGYAIFGALVAMARPGYRAPWLWPDHDRGDDYLRLIASYAALSLAFLAGIYLFRPRIVLVMAAVLPALTLFLTYVRLRRARGLSGFLSMLAAGAAALVVLACAIDGQPETDILLPAWLVRVFIVAAAAYGVYAALAPARRNEKRTLMMPGYSYLIGATGLLIISAVLPTLAMYKAAYKIELESFVKHGQLRLVQEVERRLGGAKTLPRLGIYYSFFFDTAMRHAPADLKPPLAEGRNPVPRFIEWLLPQYSDHSIRMRELLHSESADGQWKWVRRGDRLDFISSSIYGRHLVTTSNMPQLLPRWVLSRKPEPLPYEHVVERDTPDYRDVRWEDDAITRVSRYFLIFASLAAYIAFILSASMFIARKVFLVDVRDPLWLDPKTRIGPALGGNMLIFTDDAEETIARSIERRNSFVELSLATFETWESELTRIDREPPGKGVLIPDFGHKTGDAAFMKTKLELLESLTVQHTRNVIAITTVSPWAIVDAVAQTQELADRWRAVLATFNVRVMPAAEPAPRAGEAAEAGSLVPRVDRLAIRRVVNGSAAHAKELIARETAHGGDFLRQLGDELTAYDIRGQEEIYDEIGERASAYYASLWASCTSEERAVLMHIAADGFANAKDRRTIRRLLARGLVRRSPNLEIMNETFRRFLISDGCRREVVEFERSEVPESAWDKIQKPLMVGLVVGGGFFFFTQRELFDASFAVVSGVAGGVPAVLKLVGILSAPREAIASAK